GDGLSTTSGDEVLVQVLAPKTIGHMDMGEAITQTFGHVHGVGARHGGVREVEGDVGVVPVEGVPTGRVGHDLPVTYPHRVHVLHGEDDVGFFLHAGDAAFEVAGVFTLPAESRVYHDRLGTQGLGHLLGADELAPGFLAPHPLCEDKAGRVHGGDGNLVVIREAPQQVDVLAGRVGGDKNLHPVVPQLR